MARILIIEDHPDHQAIFGRLLECAGHQAISVGSGAGGLACAQQLVPGLIVLDLRLPDMSGWDVGRALKSDPRTAHIPVLVMTAEPLARELIAAPAFGCDAILLKPFNADIFLATVVRLLASQPAHPGSAPAPSTLQRSVGTPPAPAEHTPSD